MNIHEIRRNSYEFICICNFVINELKCILIFFILKIKFKKMIQKKY